MEVITRLQRIQEVTKSYNYNYKLGKLSLNVTPNPRESKKTRKQKNKRKDKGTFYCVSVSQKNERTNNNISGSLDRTRAIFSPQYKINKCSSCSSQYCTCKKPPSSKATFCLASHTSNARMPGASTPVLVKEACRTIAVRPPSES